MPTITPQAVPTEWLYIPDVPYRQDLRMQLLVPYDRTDRRCPAVLFINGAAWRRQEMYNKLPTLSNLAQRGLAVAAVQVRPSDEAVFPAQVEDVRAAAAFLRARAAEFHVDPDRLFLMGDSSGAHIALMTLLTSPELSLRGAVDISGPTDLLLCAEGQTPSGASDDLRPTERLLGLRDLRAHPEEARRASCGPYIGKRPLPPVLILHGDADPIVSVEHSRRLHRQLTAAGQPSAYYEVAGAGHGGMAFWSGEALERIADFLLHT